MSKNASLIFYIGNGIVKGAVVLQEKLKNPIILTTRVRELPYSDSRDRVELEKRILIELDALCLEIKQKDLTDPLCKGLVFNDACIVLSSPWYISQTKTIKIVEEKPFIVTEDLIHKAINDIAGPYIEENSKTVRILEQRIIKISLNGYATTDPFKKKASTMDLSVFLSYAKKSSIEDIKSTILKHIHIHTLSIHSQSLASFLVLQNIWEKETSYVLTDITSELTELLIVRAGALAEAGSFPMGKQFVVRELTTTLHTTGEVAMSFLQLYQDQKVDAALKLRIDEALVEIKKTWLKSFTKTLTDMTSGASLPSKFFLFAPRDATWLFSDFIKGEEYQQFSFSEGKFEVYDVKVTDLAEYCTFSEHAGKDLSLAMGSVFNSRIKSSDIK